MEGPSASVGGFLRLVFPRIPYSAGEGRFYGYDQCAIITPLRDVRFTYDGGATWALDGVSLDIRRGERICLAGPNGSGKSTLSRVIAGLVAPDEGYVVLSGNVVFDESGAHADEYRTPVAASARCSSIPKTKSSPPSPKTTWRSDRRILRLSMMRSACASPVRWTPWI